MNTLWRDRGILFRHNYKRDDSFTITNPDLEALFALEREEKKLIF
jgi:hypothetical protein